MSVDSDMGNKANLIWAIADKLTGVYKPSEYGKVILPLTVFRRFDCVLADTKEKVVETYKNLPENMVDEMKNFMLCEAAGHPFYNISPFDIQKLVDNPSQLEKNWKNYINGFSPNVRDIIAKFKFDDQVKTMLEKEIFYEVLKEFTTDKADLHPARVSNLEMGYIFEEIIRKFSESANEDAGQHYTPREVIQLMVDILFCEDSEALSGEKIVRSVYDPACGTGGMLSVASSYMEKLNPEAKLILSGEEINDETFAVCKSDMLIKGDNAEQIKDGNTLSNDLFEGQHFDYIISNPPFGREWKNEKTKVEAEHKRGSAGRFGPGLPAISDSQMLFLLNAAAKMKPVEAGGGRVAIIQNGSPLFTGDAGSGPSEIRKYLIENDFLEAIIALPNDIFYNTGIATYIWVLSNKKSPRRQGKVQLIDGSHLFVKRRKSLGNKRNDIPKSAIDTITRLYGGLETSDISQIFDGKDFGYQKITVERPLRKVANIDYVPIAVLQSKIMVWETEMDEGNPPSAYTKIAKAVWGPKAQAKDHREDIHKAWMELLEALRPLIREDAPRLDYNAFLKEAPAVTVNGKKLKFPVFEKAGDLCDKEWLEQSLIAITPEGDIVRDSKGEPVPDPALRDTENVPLKEDIHAYFKREVLPFAADAWIDESKTVTGYEIPFTRYFYHYEPPRPAKDIARDLKDLEAALGETMQRILGGDSHETK